MACDVEALVGHYRDVARERMRGLPIVNDRLDVEAVGFSDLGAHRFGILITPWFMNMVLLPGTDEWDGLERGAATAIALPAGDYDFTVCDDGEFDKRYLSAVLFRTMLDFPDQATARAVAVETLKLLLEPDSDTEARPRVRRYNRRQLVSGESAA